MNSRKLEIRMRTFSGTEADIAANHDLILHLEVDAQTEVAC
jgi:hypothetical protein